MPFGISETRELETIQYYSRCASDIPATDSFNNQLIFKERN